MAIDYQYQQKSLNPKNVARGRDWTSTLLLETLNFFNEKHNLIRKQEDKCVFWPMFSSYDHGHLLVPTGYKAYINTWDPAFYWDLTLGKLP